MSYTEPATDVSNVGRRSSTATGETFREAESLSIPTPRRRRPKPHLGRVLAAFADASDELRDALTLLGQAESRWEELDGAARAAEHDAQDAPKRHAAALRTAGRDGSKAPKRPDVAALVQTADEARAMADGASIAVDDAAARVTAVAAQMYPQLRERALDGYRQALANAQGKHHELDAALGLLDQTIDHAVSLDRELAAQWSRSAGHGRLLPSGVRADQAQDHTRALLGSTGATATSEAVRAIGNTLAHGPHAADAVGTLLDRPTPRAAEVPAHVTTEPSQASRPTNSRPGR